MTPHRDSRAHLHVGGPRVLRLTLIGLGLIFAALIEAPVLAVEFHPIRVRRSTLGPPTCKCARESR